MAAIETVLWSSSATQDHAELHPCGQTTQCSDDVDRLDVPRLRRLCLGTSQPVQQRLAQRSLAAPARQAHCRDAKPWPDRVGEIPRVASLLLERDDERFLCDLLPKGPTPGQHRRQARQLLVAGDVDCRYPCVRILTARSAAGARTRRRCGRREVHHPYIGTAGLKTQPHGVSRPEPRLWRAGCLPASFQGGSHAGERASFERQQSLLCRAYSP